MDNTRHTGRVALLTGAGSGIGLATATRLAGEGAIVVGCDVKAEAVAGARAAVPAGTFTVCDVTDQAGVDALVAETVAAHGRIDILGNIAGINDYFLAAHEVDDATWERVLAVNTTAVMRLCRAVLPGMQSRRAGAIVNIASIAGLGGGASGLAYTASKHAVVGMTRSIAWMYRSDGIRCNAVCPAGVRTNIISRDDPRSDWAFDRLRKFHALSDRMADADEIAALVSWLASDEASNLTGAIVTADGGWTAA
jgi:NAD(P)-dependent dehydrogenase (short-subunit alcohol dehydrogenase family)